MGGTNIPALNLKNKIPKRRSSNPKSIDQVLGLIRQFVGDLIMERIDVQRGHQSTITSDD